MNNNIKMIGIIIFGIIILYLFRTSAGQYNLTKSIQACVVAQKQTSESFDINVAKKFCEEEIRKKD